MVWAQSLPNPPEPQEFHWLPPVLLPIATWMEKIGVSPHSTHLGQLARTLKLLKLHERI